MSSPQSFYVCMVVLGHMVVPGSVASVELTPNRTVDPGNCALDHPSARKHQEAFLLSTPLHDFNPNTVSITIAVGSRSRPCCSRTRRAIGRGFPASCHHLPLVEVIAHGPRWYCSRFGAHPRWPFESHCLNLPLPQSRDVDQGILQTIWYSRGVLSHVPRRYLALNERDVDPKLH
jgi:hypothetical protein